MDRATRPGDSPVRPLRVLAAAVAGRPVAVSYLPDPAALAWTDGERIYLSAQRAAGKGARELLVQCALLAGGALSAGGLRALVGSIDERRRFLLLEVERCCALIDERLPSSFLAQLAAFRSGHAPASAAESLRIARSAARLPQPPSWYGTLRPWRVLRRSLSADGGRATDPDQLARLESRLRCIEAPEDDADDDELTRNPFWKLLSSPLGKDGFFSRFMREIFDMRSSPDRDSADSGVEGSSEIVSGRTARRQGPLDCAIRSAKTVAIPSALLGDEEGAHSYPEWDCGRNHYRPSWTCVEEVAPMAAEPHFDPASVDAGEDRPMQRALATLCLGFRKEGRQRAGDELMLDPMLRLVVDLKGGHSGDDRIYAASLRTRRDLAALILLDTSSSTLESAGGERVFDRQVRTAWSLCRSFERLGDRVAMYGFHSWGRSLVRFQHLKAFDERLGEASRQRLARLSVAGYTRCGAAIRHGTRLLERHSGMPFRILLLVSDGYPYDDQYEGRYADEDTRRALAEARARGVACLCISVGSEADGERLARAYGEAHALALEHGRQLGPRLRAAMERAIGAAAREHMRRPGGETTSA